MSCSADIIRHIPEKLTYLTKFQRRVLGTRVRTPLRCVEWKALGVRRVAEMDSNRGQPHCNGNHMTLKSCISEPKPFI